MINNIIFIIFFNSNFYQSQKLQKIRNFNEFKHFVNFANFGKIFRLQSSHENIEYMGKKKVIMNSLLYLKNCFNWYLNIARNFSTNFPIF